MSENRADSKELFRDEQGSRSMARTLLVIHFALAWAYITGVAFGAWTGHELVFGYLGAVFVALVAWAGGARIAQYVGPQIGAVASALSSRARGVDRSRKDDETA